VSLAKVRSALVQGFTDAALGFPFASENKKFTPPANAPWCELFYFPGEPVMATLGANGMDQIDGYLQVNINVPLDSGTGVAMAKADILRDYFFGGRTLTYGGQEVRIKAAGTKPGFPTDKAFKTPTVIQFYAQILRNYAPYTAASAPDSALQDDSGVYIIDG